MRRIVANAGPFKLQVQRIDGTFLEDVVGPRGRLLIGEL
jgi:hypothetical protein